MNRFAEVIVPFGLRIAWRRASWPTSRSPLSVKATTDGVVRDPSALTITVGSPPSSVAITELVVPRSMPTALAISAPPAMARRSRRPSARQCPRPHRKKGTPYHNASSAKPNSRPRASGPVSSRLGAVSAGQDHLGDRVGAEPELGGDLVRAHAALVVDQREVLLRLGPGPPRAQAAPRVIARGRAGGGGPGPAAGPGAGGLAAATPRARGLARGQLLAAGRLPVPGPLVQDLVVVGGLVHPKGEDRQALGISLLALGVGAVVVLFRPFGM